MHERRKGGVPDDDQEKAETQNATANSVAKWSFDIYYGIGATRPEKSGQTIQVSRSYM